MPFPFNINYRGDAAIQPSPLLNQFAAIAERRREENKRISQAGRVSKSFLKLVAEQTGMDAGEIDNLSNEDATARHLGLIGQQSYTKGAEDLLDALALREQREVATANQGALAGAYQDFAETGQPAEAVAAPYSNEEFDRRTSPQTPRTFLQAMAGRGAVPRDQELDLLKALQTKPAKGLPLGVTRDVGQGFVAIGTGEDFEPNIRATQKKKPLYPWLFTDNDEEFKTGLREIKDPEEAAAVIASRSAYQTALGRPSAMEKLLGDVLNPGKVGQGAPRPPTGPKAGTVEGGYRFKGGDPAKAENWEKVK